MTAMHAKTQHLSTQLLGGLLDAHLHDAGEGERRARQARAVHQRDRRAPVAVAVEERTHNAAIYYACRGPP